MNVWIFFLTTVVAAVNGDNDYQQTPLRYSVHVPQAPVGYNGHPGGYPSHPMGYIERPVGYVSHPPQYASHPMGYIERPVGYVSHPPQYPSHPVGYTERPVGFISQPPQYARHPVGFATTSHQTPFAVYSIPHVSGSYVSSAHPVSVVHGPFFAGHTVFAAPPSVTTYSVREPEMPPCKAHLPPPSSSSNTNTPSTSPQKPSAPVGLPTPPPPTGINAHYKIPNPLSLFNSFTPPSIHAYHAQGSKERSPSSQNVFSIGISTPKFDDPAYSH